MGGRTSTELGNDAVYKLSFDGVDYKIGRASDGGCNQSEKKKRWKVEHERKRPRWRHSTELELSLLVAGPFPISTWCNQREKKKRCKGNGSQIAVDIYLPARTPARCASGKKLRNSIIVYKPFQTKYCGHKSSGSPPCPRSRPRVLSCSGFSRFIALSLVGGIASLLVLMMGGGT